MRMLFYKTSLSWPRASGDDVHTYEMAKALARCGVQVGLATVRAPTPAAVQGLSLECCVSIDEELAGRRSVRLSRIQARFCSYWGIPQERITRLAALARSFRADAVVAAGRDGLPLLMGIHGPVRVWYAADEPVAHHLSQLRLRDSKSWPHGKTAAIQGLYQRAFCRGVDRVWAVTSEDAAGFCRVGGFRHADTLPNGIDSAKFRPGLRSEQSDTAIFWGRLDFGPNIQALQWFVDRIWPAVRASRPRASFTIAGFCLTPEVERLGGIPGVRIRPDVPDISAEAAQNAVVVLPFVSGGGIKNKLLEAASMGKAIVASPRALSGLRGVPPMRTAVTPSDWIAAIGELWDDTHKRQSLGAAAREWVSREHSWTTTARTALAGLDAELAVRRPA
jgi:glycosyltransferase involved in cell wall biosynthesis